VRDNTFLAMCSVGSASFGGAHAFFSVRRPPLQGKWCAKGRQGDSSLGGARCGRRGGAVSTAAGRSFAGSSLGGRLVPASKCVGSSTALVVWTVL
jgi:hypothetical protein